MKIRFFRIALLSFFVFIPILGAQTAKETPAAFLKENLDRFPMVAMSRPEIPFAKIHVIGGGKTSLEHEGRFYTGFRFTTPEWLDGQFLWMFASPGPKELRKGILWNIVPEDMPEDWNLDLSDYHWRLASGAPGFGKRFPGCDTFMIQRFPKGSLKPGQNHLVWFSFPTPEIPELRFALSVSSRRGQFELGMLPTSYPVLGPDGGAFIKKPGLKPRSVKKIVAEAVAAYRKSGIETGLSHLDRELAAYTDAGGRFRDFNYEILQKGRVEGSPADSQWTAALYEWLQQRCLAFDASLLAEEVSGEGAASMMVAHRYASIGGVMEPFIKGLEKRHVPVDPGDYPDEGPGLAALPEVRLRRYPLDPIRPFVVTREDGWVHFVNVMPRSFGYSMSILGDLEFMRGHWKTSLERRIAVADWAERMHEWTPAERKLAQVFNVEDTWYIVKKVIGEVLQALDLLEAADAEYEAILAKGWPDVFQNRSILSARHGRIAIRIELGNAEASMLGELDELYASFRPNPSLRRIAWEGVEITKARCLAALDRHDEADDILSRLADGNHIARTERIRLRFAAGRLDGLEQELITALTAYREWGRKIDEARVYSLYADFLEVTGRYGEAIQMRREAIRLMRGFDLFSLLPPELARLSSMLARAGDATGAQAAGGEARSLAARRERIPERIAGKVADILSRTPSAPVIAAASAPSVDLQPSRALVIPIEGRPLRGKLTLSNPSTKVVEGALGFEGMPVEISADQEAGDIHVLIGGNAGQDRISQWRLDPGSYTLISLSSSGGATPEGELNVWWTSSGQEEKRSLWTFEAAEQGVSSAVIDAGEYQLNPFYGVPIHHHYQHASADAAFASLRVTASAPARIECYSKDDQPIFIDANGNGSLADSGDELFADENRDGHADIRLSSGEGMVRLQVFPKADIPEEGLVLTLEAIIDGQWTKIAEDRLLP